MTLFVYDALSIQNLNNATGQFNSGFFRISSTPQPAVNTNPGWVTVAQLRFQATAFQGASGSGGLVIAQAFPLTPDTSAVGGVPVSFVCFDAFGDPLVTGTAGTFGTDLILPVSSYPAGAIVQLNSFTIAVPGY